MHNNHRIHVIMLQISKPLFAPQM